MNNPATRDHKVDRAGSNDSVGTDRIHMVDCALEQIGHGRQIDVRMGSDIHAFAGRELGGTKVIEENPRSDRARCALRQGAANGKLAQIFFLWRDYSRQACALNRLGVGIRAVSIRHASPYHDLTHLRKLVTGLHQIVRSGEWRC